jgi:hypothetical protein
VRQKEDKMDCCGNEFITLSNESHVYGQAPRNKNQRYGSLSYAVFLSLLLTTTACAPKVIPVAVDADGCTVPMQLATEKKNEIDLTIAKVGEIGMGGRLTREQRVINLLSDAATNQLVMNYILCRNIAVGILDKNDRALTRYFIRRLEFVATQPTPDQVMAWEKSNPEPPPSKRSVGKEIGSSMSKDSSYILTTDVGRFMKESDERTQYFAAGKESIFRFAAEFENGYAVEFKSVKPVALVSGARGKAGDEMNLVEPQVLYQIEKAHLQEYHYEYVNGPIHGPLVAYFKNRLLHWSSKTIVMKDEPLIGYFFGYAMGRPDTGKGLVVDAGRSRLTVAPFLYIGVTRIPAEDISPDALNDKYAGSYGIGVLMGIGQRFQIGAILLGVDHINNESVAEKWKYQDKPYTSLTIGWNFGG